MSSTWQERPLPSESWRLPLPHRKIASGWRSLNAVDTRAQVGLTYSRYGNVYIKRHDPMPKTSEVPWSPPHPGPPAGVSTESKFCARATRGFAPQNFVGALFFIYEDCR